MSWLDGITDAVDRNLGELREAVRGREAWCPAVQSRRVGHEWEPNKDSYYPSFSFLALQLVEPRSPKRGSAQDPRSESPQPQPLERQGSPKPSFPTRCFQCPR